MCPNWFPGDCIVDSKKGTSATEAERKLWTDSRLRRSDSRQGLFTLIDTGVLGFQELLYPLCAYGKVNISSSRTAPTPYMTTAGEIEAHSINYSMQWRLAHGIRASERTLEVDETLRFDEDYTVQIVKPGSWSTLKWFGRDLSWRKKWGSQEWMKITFDLCPYV